MLILQGHIRVLACSDVSELEQMAGFATSGATSMLCTHSHLCNQALSYGKQAQA